MGKHPFKLGFCSPITLGYLPYLINQFWRRYWLKTNPLQDTDLQDFITVYNPENRETRVETDQFRAYTYNELIEREHVNLDIFSLKDGSLEDAADLPAPDVLAAEITKNLEAALTQFQNIQAELDNENTSP